MNAQKPRMGKSIGTENRYEIARNWGKGEWEMTNGYRTSF